jgi:glycosyltransferase involved in cell wall biosynthesis
LKQPIRVLIGCDTFAPDINGAARFTERLAAGLVQRGDDVHIAAPSITHSKTGAFRETVEGQTMTVHRLASWRLHMHEWLRYVLPWTARAKARKLLDQVQPDVVHIQSHIVIGRYLAYEAARRDIRVIATSHVMPENIVDLWAMPKLVRKLIVRWGWYDVDKVLRIAEAVTTPTRRAAEYLESNTSRRGVLPVSCGIDASQYRADLTPRSQKRLVFVGRMTQEKHVDVILRALSRLGEDVSLDLIGQGDQRHKLEDLARELGVADRVNFHGKTTDAELRNCLSSASIFVIASIAELQSIATLEAMASGLPVIAADAMALPHLVDGNGYLFTPGDDAELARYAREIFALSPQKYRELQEASLKAIQIHDIANTLDVFQALYRGQRDR